MSNLPITTVSRELLQPRSEWGLSEAMILNRVQSGKKYKQCQ